VPCSEFRAVQRESTLCEAPSHACEVATCSDRSRLFLNVASLSHSDATSSNEESDATEVE
jgi:hypothetical protein